MLRVILCIIMIMYGTCVYAEDTKSEDIKSTQGLEINKDVINSGKSQIDMSAYKSSRKATKKYLKRKKQIRKLDAKKDTKQRELEFLQKKLDVKKNKVEALSSDKKKGEK